MILPYNKKLKSNSRLLRNNLTEAEKILWSHLRRKQLLNVQFYRQKPIGNYIVDFYAPSAKLIIEVDGGQHFEEHHKQRDDERDRFMEMQGFKVLRFSNRQVLLFTKNVIIMIFNTITYIPAISIK